MVFGVFVVFPLFSLVFLPFALFFFHLTKQNKTKQSKRVLTAAFVRSRFHLDEEDLLTVRC